MYSVLLRGMLTGTLVKDVGSSSFLLVLDNIGWELETPFLVEQVQNKEEKD